MQSAEALLGSWPKGSSHGLHAYHSKAGAFAKRCTAGASALEQNRLNTISPQLRAKALKEVDDKLRAQKLIDERYASWSGPLGRRIDAGSESFESLEKEMLAKGDSAPCGSGRQELFENLVNTYI